MKKIFTKEFYIGLSVIVAILILFFGIDYLKGINLFQPSNFYTVEYDNVMGLERSAPVTVNGFKVGQVREMEFDYANPCKVKVTLAINGDLKVPQDSKAALASTLLSGSYVNIIMGSSDKILPVGSAIQPQAGSDLMATVEDKLLPPIYDILPKIDSILNNFNQISGDPALLQSVQRIDAITGNIELASVGLNRSVNGIPMIIGGVRSTMTKVDSIVSNLQLISSELKTLPLQPTMDNVERLTSNLEAFSKQLNNQHSTLGKLTTDAELYDRINTVATDIDSLIVDIKKNPKRYISIKLL